MRRDRNKVPTINGVPMACCSQIFDKSFMKANFPNSCKSEDEEDENVVAEIIEYVQIPRREISISIGDLTINIK